MRLRAVVREGRIVVDEPTSLPNGTVLDLVVDDESDNLDEASRSALDAVLAKGFDEVRTGHGRMAAHVLAELRARRK